MMRTKQKAMQNHIRKMQILFEEVGIRAIYYVHACMLYVGR